MYYCFTQQQAEHDNEQKKKQEIAAEEQAAAPSPKKKDGSPQKVYLQKTHIFHISCIIYKFPIANQIYWLAAVCNKQSKCNWNSSTIAQHNKSFKWFPQIQKSPTFNDFNSLKITQLLDGKHL